MPATVTRRRARLGGARRRLLGARRRLLAVERGTLARLGIVALTAYAAWLAIGVFGRPYTFFDMKIYHGAMVWWANGHPLYEFVAPQTTLGFTYPPFAALLMLPMAALSVPVAALFNLLASLTALTLILITLLRPLADRLGQPLWFVVALAVPLATALEPVRETLGFGQVNLLLFALVLADLVALRRRARRGVVGGGEESGVRRFLLSGAWAGVGIGLATSIKLTPALFILYLMLTRQWRAAWTAIGTAVTVVCGVFAVLPAESTAYFGTVIWQTERVGAADMTPNQSLAGLLARLHDMIETPTLLWFSFAVLVLVLGLDRARAAHADGDELTAFTLVGLTGNIISPISWTHHLVWVIPALIVLADTGLRRREARRWLPPPAPGGPGALPGLHVGHWWPTVVRLRHLLCAGGLYLLFVVSPIWPYEHQLPEVSHYHDGFFGALLENSLVLALIVLVTTLPWRPGAESARQGGRPALAASAAR